MEVKHSNKMKVKHKKAQPLEHTGTSRLFLFPILLKKTGPEAGQNFHVRPPIGFI